MQLVDILFVTQLSSFSTWNIINSTENNPRMFCQTILSKYFPLPILAFTSVFELAKSSWFHRGVASRFGISVGEALFVLLLFLTSILYSPRNVFGVMSSNVVYTRQIVLTIWRLKYIYYMFVSMSLTKTSSHKSRNILAVRSICHPSGAVNTLLRDPRWVQSPNDDASEE